MNDALWLILALLMSAALVSCGYGPDRTADKAPDMTTEGSAVLETRQETESAELTDLSSPFPFHEIVPTGGNMGTGFFTGDAWAQFFRMGTNLPTFALVTFAPGVRNSWHSHGGGQALIVTGGEGWVEEEGGETVFLREGDVWYSPPGVTHWHGAAENAWFQHIAVETNADMGGTTFLDPVSDEDYAALTPPVPDRDTAFTVGERMTDDSVTGAVWAKEILLDKSAHVPPMRYLTLSSGASVRIDRAAVLLVTGGSGRFMNGPSGTEVDVGTQITVPAGGDCSVTADGVLCILLVELGE